MKETKTELIRIKVTDEEKAQLDTAYNHLVEVVRIMKRIRDEAGDRGREMIRKDANSMDGVYTINTSDAMQGCVDSIGDAMAIVWACRYLGYYIYDYEGEYEDGGTDWDLEARIGQQEQEARDRAWEG